MKTMLAFRRALKNRTPTFLRQEWMRYGRLDTGTWRKPKGTQSQMRHHYNGRINVVSIGFRGPKEVRGLHPSGFKEVLVYNPADLDKIDPKTQAARIARTVGDKKREQIEHRAEELKIRILNKFE